MATIHHLPIQTFAIRFPNGLYFGETPLAARLMVENLRDAKLFSQQDAIAKVKKLGPYSNMWRDARVVPGRPCP